MQQSRCGTTPGNAPAPPGTAGASAGSPGALAVGGGGGLRADGGLGASRDLREEVIGRYMWVVRMGSPGVTGCFRRITVGLLDGSRQIKDFGVPLRTARGRGVARWARGCEVTHEVVVGGARLRCQGPIHADPTGHDAAVAQTRQLNVLVGRGNETRTRLGKVHKMAVLQIVLGFFLPENVGQGMSREFTDR